MVMVNDKTFMPFDRELVSSAMSRELTKFYLQPSDQHNYFSVDRSLPGAPQYAMGEWGQPGKASAEAFQYLASVCAVSPDFAVSGGASVEQRTLEHIRSIIGGGNEWGCAGSGLSPQGYYQGVIGFAIIKILAPDTWNKLTDDEKEKADLLMQATLIGTHYSNADANYNTPYPNKCIPVLWAANPFNVTTGVDQTGNYHRNWNLNHRVGVLTAAAVYYYFGGKDGGSEYCNNLLANFDYDCFSEKLSGAGLTNVLTVFGNAGKHPDVGLERWTRSSSLSPAGEYTYFGNTLDEIGEWLKRFITGGLTAGPVRPYGGDTNKPDLPPSVENYPPFDADTSIVRPFGYPGYLEDENDILLNFPNLGAPGMMAEFDVSDGGHAKAPDTAASGARSSVSYVSAGVPPVMNAFYMLQAFDMLNETGTHIAGIQLEEYTGMLVMTAAGIKDYLYKAAAGYQGYHKGFSRRDEKNNSIYMRYTADIWDNFTDRPAGRIEAVNKAESVSGISNIRNILEDPLFGLVLFQYNGLSSAGKDAVAETVMNNAPYLFKRDIQKIIDCAVESEAVKEFNALLAGADVTAQQVLNALSVNLDGRQPSDAYVPNALGIFVYGFTDIYTYKSEAGKAARLAAADYVLKEAPENGYADKRAIRGAIIRGLNY